MKHKAPAVNLRLPVAPLHYARYLLVPCLHGLPCPLVLFLLDPLTDLVFPVKCHLVKKVTGRTVCLRWPRATQRNVRFGSRSLSIKR